MKHWIMFLAMSLPLLMTGQTLGDLNVERVQTSKKGLLVLGGWAVSNLAYSGARYFGAEGEAKRFHQMNVWWNVVNLGLAGAGYLGARKSDTDLDLPGSFRAQSNIEKTYLFNTGLDVGYMAFGLYLVERSKSEVELAQQERFSGWGKSLVLQGGFLFAYDLAMYLVHRRHGERGLIKLLERVEPAGMGLRLTLPIGG